MKKNVQIIRRIHCTLIGTPMSAKLHRGLNFLVGALIVLALLMPVRATQADQIVNVTEAMIGLQAADMLLLGSVFGADASSTLNFTSSVDPGGSSFSFLVQPGLTYKGQSITMDGMGTYDSGTSTWTTTTSWSLGSSSFNDLGTQKITTMLDGSVKSEDDYDFFDKNGKKIGDIHFDRTWKKQPNSNNWESTSKDYFTDKNGKKIQKSDTEDVDVYIPLKLTPNNWSMLDISIFTDSPFPFVLTSSGYSPGTGGDGSFSSTLAPVPEPSTLVLLGAGLLGYARRRRAKHV